MSRADESLMPSRAFPSSPVPATYAVHPNGWLPVIHHPAKARFLQFEEFRRKVKPTAAEAIRYARHTIWYRQRRENEKRRRLEGLSSPHWIDMSCGEYESAPPTAQRAFNAALLKLWQGNREAELDADFRADHSDHRRAWEGSWS